ncbi:PREDICTED: alpha-(1,3)-fucosyltransferase C-like [Ceratosolen solmsi marchali]|uniref:Fucosyltransferase n=1 Tax=Ceratosolen solmsi marchali TaxID=326594 RepID=A0AAJ6YTE7_9HYME|nr:PREDICTED: alpha-(1,3)-fucosyltransferase C-like [Ceratosolen solmsi marchali]
MSRRRFFLLLVFALGLCLGLFLYANLSSFSSLAAYALTQGGLPPKTILYWNSFFGEEDFYLGDGQLARDCPRFNNCFAVHSRLLHGVHDFDAVVFHGISGQLDYADLPLRRRPEQRYVFVALESPANRFITELFDDYFNLTMTYQLDSDIVWSYADLKDRIDETIVRPVRSGNYKWREAASEKENPEDAKLLELIRAKRKIAVWYRSHCTTRSARESYVAELEKHMYLDKYGGCSLNPGCPKEGNCFEAEVEPNYFFYLSFENSLCSDYVTEKFFNALRYNVVPVVYGGAYYSDFAPPKSYINALDFDTPKDLAKYLIQLSHNLTEYKTYFDWKKQYRVVQPKQRIICDLCEILNGSYKATYKISKWYSIDRCPLQRKLDKQKRNGDLNYATKRTFLVR